MMGKTADSGLVEGQGAAAGDMTDVGGVRLWWREVRASHFRLWDVTLAFSMVWGIVWGGVFIAWANMWWVAPTVMVGSEKEGGIAGTALADGWFPIVVQLIVVLAGAAGWWMFSSVRLRNDNAGVWGGSAWERYALVWCCAAVAYGTFTMVTLLSAMNGMMTDGAV